MARVREDRIRLFEPRVRQWKCYNSGLLNGPKHATVDITLQASNGIDKLGIPNQHSYTEPRHVIRLAQRMQFNSDFACSWNLQDAHRAKLVKVHLGVGHVMDDHQVETVRKLYRVLEKSQIGACSRRIVVAI